MWHRRSDEWDYCDPSDSFSQVRSSTEPSDVFGGVSHSWAAGDRFFDVAGVHSNPQYSLLAALRYWQAAKDVSQIKNHEINRSMNVVLLSAATNMWVFNITSWTGEVKNWCGCCCFHVNDFWFLWPASYTWIKVIVKVIKQSSKYNFSYTKPLGVSILSYIIKGTC